MALNRDGAHKSNGKERVKDPLDARTYEISSDASVCLCIQNKFLKANLTSSDSRYTFVWRCVYELMCERWTMNKPFHSIRN